MKETMKFIYALSILSSTIIGAGIFALPYITAQVGIWMMLVYFVVLTTIVIIIHQLYGELARHTPDRKRLPGFASIYLGIWGKRISLITVILGSFGSILAYLILGGEFLAKLLMPVIGGGNFLYFFIYFLSGALLIYFGIKAVAKIEFWGLILFFAVLIAIFWRGISQIEISNIMETSFNWKYLFLPYGALIFSLWGASLIPEAEEILEEKKDSLQKVISLAIIISAVVYLIFIFLTLGISGTLVSVDSVSGLKLAIGDGVIVLVLFFGLITTYTSYISLGLTLRKIFCYDLNMSRIMAWLTACFVPLLLYFLGFNNFVGVIGFVGGIMLATDGILIILMFRKLVEQGSNQEIKFRKLYFLTHPLILLLLLGIVYQIIYFIK